MPTQAKENVVESLRGKLVGVETAVLTEYRGMTVQQLSELRRQLKTVAAEYKVVKNRLARRAVQGSPLGLLEPHLKGPTGLVLGGKDAVRVAKTLTTFVRANPALGIKLAYVQGQLIQPPELRALADLPSREALLGRLVGQLQAPVAQLVFTLEGMLRALVSVLEQVGQKREP